MPDHLLQTHLDSLLKGAASCDTDKQEWLALLEEFEAAKGSFTPPDEDEAELDGLTSQTTAWPSLLDYFSQPPQHGEPSTSPSSKVNGIGAGSALSPPPVDALQDGQVSPNLHERLKEHLPSPSLFNSLITLVTSSRSNDDIQSELVEILGFEGNGLALVEELLRPGVRDVLSADLQGDSKKGKRSGTSTPRTYLPSARMTVNAAKGKEKKQMINLADAIGTNADIERRIQEQLERPKAMFSDDDRRIVEQEILPHVFTSSANVTSSSMSYGGKFALPVGTMRELNDTYEEVIIPHSKPIPPRQSERPVRIHDLPPLAKGCFPNYVTLNRMQSIVQPIAMNTNENMLVCAPTGAGKTDVAIMSILRVLAQHVKPGKSTHPSGFTIDKDAFKIIYVAPMKALAAEITRKFGKRLAWLGIRVRELTGDMQLTREEIAETQIIVTTPEKWDVVTRKPTGEGELASKVKLLIIDEVHLLNEERGAVIETIVARTLRQVESSQSLIRIVGLSATLPNYIDVSDFLRVNRYQGLFFFDSSFRPVPLEQHFLGVAGKPRSQQSIRNMDQVVFEKVSQLVEAGHQVMVFVHARKETVNSAKKLKEQSMEEGMTSFFETIDHPKYQLYRREISTSRNKEMKELFDAGFGIHHAGMLRSDRNMMEKMFEDQAIKVLCCTATLAWGVNLPAHAVVIKGTQVYDSSRGAFVDLSVLDVLQIFGRAGRPGYETSGEGYICTTQDKLDHYLHAIMAQHPIESKFIPGMVDALNAEVALGTIANVADAIQWLGYTYLFVRMRREPFIYGMPHDEPKDDPQLGNKRNELIIQAARQLSSAKMIRYDENKNSFVISDLGRIAAKYYLRHQTMEIFNTMFHPKMRNADLFAMLSQATEFDQIQVRENEVEELIAILETEEYCPLEVKGGVSNKHGKVNILLQAHISKVYLEDFALVADAAYVAQNAARIIRALLEIALSRNWANNAKLLIDLSKAIEKRMWPYDHPLAQLPTLHKDTLHNLRQWADEVEIAVLRHMDTQELGEMIHMNERHGAAVREAAQSLPMVDLTHSLRPLTHDLLELRVRVEPLFKWNNRVSTSAEPFYIWVQDEDEVHILQWRSILLRSSTTSIDIEFVLPLGDTPPPFFKLVSASDRWLGSEEEKVISLDGLVMPQPAPESTTILDIPYLHISCLNDTQLEQAYRAYITTLNSIQTQCFWTCYHSQSNVLISAPIAGGKSFLAEMAIWHTLRTHEHAAVMVLAPTRSAAMEVTARIRSVCPKSMGVSVRSLLNPADFDVGPSNKSVCVTSPASLLSVDHEQMTDFLKGASLFVLEDLHLLDEFYELSIAKILSIARPSRARIVGITSSLNDPSDLAAWLGVEPASSYVFSPRDRGQPIHVSIKTFTIPHSTTLLRTMTKPAYDALKQIPGGTILFAPSRAACRSIAADLVTQSGTEMDLNGFLTAPRADVEPLLQRLRDSSLHEPLLHGIGFVVSGMAPSDLALVLELFASGIVRALIAPREACWTLPVRGQTVIVMGAQYVETSNGERRVVNYSRTELVKMQGFAVTSALSASTSGGGRMFVMCQAEQQTTISRTLNDGLPLESNLPALIRRQTSPIAEGRLSNLLKARPAPSRPSPHNPRRHPDLRKRDLVDLLGWTYFALRAKSNPTYYDITPGSEEEEVSRMVDVWFADCEFADSVPGSTLSGLGSRSMAASGSGSAMPSREPSALASISREQSAEVEVEGGDKVTAGVKVNGHSAGMGAQSNGMVNGKGKGDGGVEVETEVPDETGVGDMDGETADAPMK